MEGHWKVIGLPHVGQKFTLYYYLESTFYEGLQFTPTQYFQTSDQTGNLPIQLKTLLNNHLHHITFMTQSLSLPLPSLPTLK